MILVREKGLFTVGLLHVGTGYLIKSTPRGINCNDIQLINYLVGTTRYKLRVCSGASRDTSLAFRVNGGPFVQIADALTTRYYYVTYIHSAQVLI